MEIGLKTDLWFGNDWQKFNGYHTEFQYDQISKCTRFGSFNDIQFCPELTKWFSAWYCSIPSVAAAKPKCVLSALLRCGFAQRFVLACGHRPGCPTGQIHLFALWFRPDPSSRSSWGDGLRGDDVDLIQVVLGEVLIISKWVIKGHRRCYFVIQSSETLRGRAVHAVREEERRSGQVNQLTALETFKLRRSVKYFSFLTFKVQQGFHHSENFSSVSSDIPFISKGLMGKQR